jgi:glycerol kinase
LLFHLLREKPLVVDHANASRTQLWNLQSRNWDPWLLDLFKIPPEPLPHCRPICYAYGRLDAADIPLTAVNGDQTAAVFALGRPRPETAIVNMGSGAFILRPTGKRMVYHPRLLSGLARSSEKLAEYIVEGTVNGAGSALDWAATRWDLTDVERHLPAWLDRLEPPPVFINTIGGLGSPWWQPGPGPALIGRGAPWQKAVAVVESILFMLQANFETMCAADLSIRNIQISGGLAHLQGLCQRLADLTQRPVYRPAETEATARGIAWLASGAPQNWPKPGRGRWFYPQANHFLAARYRIFRQALN